MGTASRCLKPQAMRVNRTGGTEGDRKTSPVEAYAIEKRSHAS
jgi:hypothetical protein